MGGKGELVPGHYYEVPYDSDDGGGVGFGRAVSEKEVLWLYTREDLEEIQFEEAHLVPEGAYVVYGTDECGHVDEVVPELCRERGHPDSRVVNGKRIVGFVFDPCGPSEKVVLYPSRMERDAEHDARVGVSSSLSYTRPLFERAIEENRIVLSRGRPSRQMCDMCMRVRNTRFRAHIDGYQYKLGPVCFQRVRRAMEVARMLRRVDSDHHS